MGRSLWLWLLLAIFVAASGCACTSSSVFSRNPDEDRYSAKYD